MPFDQRTLKCYSPDKFWATPTASIRAAVANTAVGWQALVMPSSMMMASENDAGDANGRWFRVDLGETWSGQQPLCWMEQIGTHHPRESSPSVGMAKEPARFNHHNAKVIPARFEAAEQVCLQLDNLNHEELHRASTSVTIPRLASDACHSARHDRPAFERGVSYRSDESRPAGDAAGLLAEAAHDIRSPIASASQIVSMLSKKMRGGQPLSNAELGLLDVANLRLVQANTWAESILSERSLELGRPVVVRSRFYPNQLQNLVKPLLDSLAKLRDVQLNWEGWDRSLPRVYTDASHLSRIIMNLGTNAIEASQPGQCVSIAVAGPRTTRKRLTIDIQDHGPGLDPVLLRALNSFDSRRPVSRENPHHLPRSLSAAELRSRSLGLGLQASQKLILGLGGSLSASSRTGDGTRMRLCLPIDETQCLVSSWLNSLSTILPESRKQSLQRVEIHAVRLRGMNPKYADRELQLAAGQSDFIYRVGSDRWLWLTLVDQAANSPLALDGFAKRVDNLGSECQAICQHTKVFQSRVFALSSLQSASSDRNQLPVLISSISSKITHLMGDTIPRIDDLESIDSVVFGRPNWSHRVDKIIRTDGVEKIDSHLRNVRSSSTQESTSAADGRKLPAALGEIAEAWHETQRKLDRVIRRVDVPGIQGPKERLAAEVRIDQ